MSNIAIRAENLGKMYRIGGTREKYSTFRHAITRTVSTPVRRVRNIIHGQGASNLKEKMWALRNVSFEVQHGEVVGIIGRNGAGKSTLLKLLSRISEPTTGYADIYGRVGALLEVGTGFHPELTGRENVYLNGAILGMSRNNIDRKFDAIVDFAGIDKFIDTPVKFYSSGMGLRLGFAVAAHLEPEILIVDEVLAVGDVEFQRKCLGKMSEVADAGRTVLFVSHNLSSIQSLCDRCIVLNEGCIAFDGNIDLGIGHYLSKSNADVDTEIIPMNILREGTGVVIFTGLRIRNQQEDLRSQVITGEDVIFELDYQYKKPHITPGNLFFFIHINTLLGERLFVCSTRYAYYGPTPSSSGTIRCVLPKLPLVPGAYRIDITCKIDKEIYDSIVGVKTIEVIEGDYFGTGKIPPASSGNMLVKQEWSIVAHPLYKEDK